MFAHLDVMKWRMRPYPSRRVARTTMLVLAFVALGFAALRPFCELAFGGHGQSEIGSLASAAANTDHDDTPSGTCCDSVKDGTLLKAAEPLIQWAKGASFGSAFLASAGLLLLARPRDSAGSIRPAPLVRPFYARSARILR